MCVDVQCGFPFFLGLGQLRLRVDVQCGFPFFGLYVSGCVSQVWNRGDVRVPPTLLHPPSPSLFSLTFPLSLRAMVKPRATLVLDVVVGVLTCAPRAIMVAMDTLETERPR